MSKRSSAAESGERPELTPKQETAAVALAGGATEAQAAEKAGVHERTISSWKNLPAFRARVKERQAELINHAMGKLASDMASGATTIGFLSRKAKSEQVRLGAARSLIELGVKLKDSTEIEERIAALEEGQK